MGVSAVIENKAADDLRLALARRCAESSPILSRHLSGQVADLLATNLDPDRVGVMLVAIFAYQRRQRLDIVVDAAVRPILLPKVTLIARFPGHLDGPSTTASEKA